MIFKFLVLAALAIPSYKVTYDTGTLIYKGQACGDKVACYWFDREQLEEMKVTKVLDSTFPKYLKFECEKKGCWVRLYGPI